MDADAAQVERVIKWSEAQIIHDKAVSRLESIPEELGRTGPCSAAVSSTLEEKLRSSRRSTTLSTSTTQNSTPIVCREAVKRGEHPFKKDLLCESSQFLETGKLT